MAKKSGAGKIAAFAGKYSNKGTGYNYRHSIEAFLRCLKTPDGEDVDETATYEYEALLDDYLKDRKRNVGTDIKKFAKYLKEKSVSMQSARQQLTYAVKFLRAHGVNILKEDIEDVKREAKGGAATVDKVMTSEVICQALKSSDVRTRALILVLASSGMRIGESLSLDISDIDMNTDPVMINIRPENTKTKKGRYTFITAEAREALTEYLAVRGDYVQSANRRIEQFKKAGKEATVNAGDRVFPLEDSSVNKIWETTLKRAGLYSRDVKSGRNQYRIHSLRKFFISKLSLAGARTLAEHLAGHEGYLDASYRQVSPEFAAREYQKLQSVLVCCIPESIKSGIKVADEKIGVLMEKTELQSESIEGMKAINRELKGQIHSQGVILNRIDAENADLKSRIQKQEEAFHDLNARNEELSRSLDDVRKLGGLFASLVGLIAAHPENAPVLQKEIAGMMKEAVAGNYGKNIQDKMNQLIAKHAGI